MLSFAVHAKRCLTTLELMLIFVTLIHSLFMFLGSGVGRKATDIRGDRSSGTNLAGRTHLQHLNAGFSLSQATELICGRSYCGKKVHTTSQSWTFTRYEAQVSLLSYSSVSSFRRHCGWVVRALGFKSSVSKFTSCSHHPLDLFQVVPGSTPWQSLY